MVAKLAAELAAASAKRVRYEKEYAMVEKKALEKASCLAAELEQEDEERERAGLEPLGAEADASEDFQELWSEMLHANPELGETLLI